MSTMFRCICVSAATILLLFPSVVEAQSSYSDTYKRPEKRTATTPEESRGFWDRLLNRNADEEDEKTIFDRLARQRPKSLTVPEDTINALKLEAQDWVLDMRDKTAEIKRTPAGAYVKEYSTFSDRYTIEIEAAPDDEEDATFIGYVFLDSTYLRTQPHDTAADAEADKAFSEEPRKIRMRYKLIEEWEYSDIAGEYVFNRRWDLAQVQFKPLDEFQGIRTPRKPLEVPDLGAPETTPQAAADSPE